MRVNAKEVARRAGMSRSAVSLVLNDRADGQISVENQERIRRIAAELGYTPSAIGRELRSQQTQLLGVVTDSIVTSAFGGKIVRGAQDAAIENDFLLLLMETQSKGDRRDAFRILRSRRVEGLLLAAMTMKPVRVPDELLDAPSVLANCFDPDDRVGAVLVDEVEGGRRAAQALLDAGHRDIAMFAGLPTVVGRRRVSGFEHAMEAAGVQWRQPVVTGWEINKGYRAGMHVLGGGDRPTGIVCANDRVAVGVALAAVELDLRVPDDVSLVGYDDDENLAPFMTPSLTTVALPHRAIGYEAIRRLVRAVTAQRLDGGSVGGPGRDNAGSAPGVSNRVMLVGDLVQRDSVGPPR